ncbi:DegT/DnrJ/EryC1/StrS family aminotransferase [Streptomyces dangxiongensis]|uniref:DegT/DnrJ/EryC1/StrS family aminotransferase n=2 Tax=Streptomyces dangxiongensis TaxID=1442032 RepID=A0A3G2JMS3_9ACTN|nr:DegT/DnrJ/EryC1/StrS family aminotransferase [Streptomyces dangxiongensis]
MRGLALWGEEEKAAALEVLESRSLFRYYGPALQHRVAEFERRFAAVHEAPYAVGVSSGTAALTCALIGMGMPAGAEVIVPAATFVGCVSAVVAARGVPVFADIDASLTLDPTAWESLVTERTFAVMPVHLNHAAADMDPVLAVARRHGIRVLEDAAQACGVSYRGRPAGSLGDAGAFSFQLEKNITAGEGGAVVTGDPLIHDRVARYQDQGGQFFTSRGGERGGTEGGPFLGANLRMTEIAGALLSVQLDRLPGMLTRLRDIARTVRKELSGLDVTWRTLPDEEGSGGDLTLLAEDRMAARRLVTRLTAAGVPAATLYQGRTVYQNPAVHAGRTAWGTEWTPPARLRASEALLGRSVTVGLGATMTDDDVTHVIDSLRAALTAGAAGSAR